MKKTTSQFFTAEGSLVMRSGMLRTLLFVPASDSQVKNKEHIKTKKSDKNPMQSIRKGKSKRINPRMRSNYGKFC